MRRLKNLNIPLSFNIIIFAILGIALSIFIFKSVTSMIYTPFNEFDEAHRAENAKRMNEYKSYLVPLTGSPFDRVGDLRIQSKESSFSFLYYHLERPPLVYLLMVMAINVFGSAEWVYRLPSFIFGILSFAVFIYFSRKIVEKGKVIALAIGLLCLITSSDLWLSSQYAQLDTGLTTSLFLSLLSLIYFCEVRKFKYLFLGSLGFALGVLTKGQPTVILIFPIIYLLWIKKFKWTDLFKFLLMSLLIISPWIIYMIFNFGVAEIFKIYVGFAFNSAVNDEVHHLAPFFWYGRWLWDSLRPGFTLFITLFITEIFQQKLDWKKKSLLIYIIVGLALFSLPHNKLWWYILPLIPAMCFYVYLAVNDLLDHKKDLLINLSIIIAIASRPVLGSANRVAIFYGIIITLISLYILNGLGTTLKPAKRKLFVLQPAFILVMALIFSLLSFFLRFPQIIPYHWSIKPVASIYTQLPYPKCLWIYDVPSESILFYSGAVEVHVLNERSKLFGHCTNYLITVARSNELPNTEIKDVRLIYSKENMKLFEIK